MMPLTMLCILLVFTIKRLLVAWAQTRWPRALRVRTSTCEGRRLAISSAMRLLKASERIGIPVMAWQIISRVVVLALPAKAFIMMLSCVPLAASMIAACSGVGGGMLGS